jgi:deoxycytidylate deaminase
VYGKQFVLLCAYAPQDVRLKRIEDKARNAIVQSGEQQSTLGGAFDLIEQDTNEADDENGQNVRDAFPLGDVFIDASTRKSTEETVKRFVNLFFNNPQITPTPDEYGMYIAKSVSLRSSDLSRQVGAAIFKSSREIVSLGCNEVPKAGGGTYWEGDEPDARDFQLGYDSNERQKTRIILDLVERLRQGGHLSDSLAAISDVSELSARVLGDPLVAQSNAMSLIEFGRAVHAEASALADAARLGRSVKGATLYCTTFPCHLCATAIIAAGIQRVVFVEPYPKSYAKELHDDAITLTTEAGKVSFEPFVGVSPFRYRDLFEKKEKRKYAGGRAHEWREEERRPLIEVYHPTYFRAETSIVSQLNERLEARAEQD